MPRGEVTKKEECFPRVTLSRGIAHDIEPWSESENIYAKIMNLQKIKTKMIRILKRTNGEHVFLYT